MRQVQQKAWTIFDVPLLFLSIIMLWVGMIVSSCQAPEKRGSIRSDPDFVGFITAVQRGTGTGEVIGQIAVESHAQKLVHRQIVLVTRDTMILKHSDEGDRETNFDSLKPKNWLRVWFAGPVKKPYPTPALAQRLMIVDRP